MEYDNNECFFKTSESSEEWEGGEIDLGEQDPCHGRSRAQHTVGSQNELFALDTFLSANNVCVIDDDAGQRSAFARNEQIIERKNNNEDNRNLFAHEFSTHPFDRTNEEGLLPQARESSRLKKIAASAENTPPITLRGRKRPLC